jgi:hypothetical protein
MHAHTGPVWGFRVTGKHHRRAAIPAFVQAAIYRTERERKARQIALPMRALFDLLATGEVMEIDGHAVMRMPECDERVTERTEWCAVAPAIRGWVDFWQKIDASMDSYHLQVLAERLESDKPITPRLVELARADFESHISRIPEIPDGRIKSAITTAQIQWELERQGETA